MYEHSVYFCYTNTHTHTWVLQAELSQKGQEVEKLRREVEDLGKQVTQLKEGEARASEVEQALQKSEMELNHWKQKSVQQDMVMQTRTQVDYCL